MNIASFTSPRTHATASEYDRLRHELDALMHAPQTDRTAIEKIVAQLDQVHADYKSACLAMRGQGGVIAGAALRPEGAPPTASQAAPHRGGPGHAPGAGHHTQEGPAQPGELPAHWATN